MDRVRNREYLGALRNASHASEDVCFWPDADIRPIYRPPALLPRINPLRHHACATRSLEFRRSERPPLRQSEIFKGGYTAPILGSERLARI